MKLLVFALVLLGCLQSSAAAQFQVEALYEMRQQLIDNRGVLNDWKDNQMSPCYWDHVTCQDNKVAKISLSSSGLTGTLSPSIANLTTLQQLILHGNSITGVIPQEFGNLSSLTTLDLGKNNLNGSIPDTLGRLPKLEILDLSQNHLSGSIPSSFINLQSLNNINLAYNNLSGEIPQYLLQVPQYNYTGTHLNCGQRLFPCQGGSTKTDSGGSKNSKLKVALGSIAGAVTLLVLGVLFVLWWQRMRYRPEIFIDVSGQNDHRLEFGQIKRFSWREHQIATNNFSEQNVLGKGGFGKVYKGVLPGPNSVKIAVKRLSDVQSPEGEMATEDDRSRTLKEMATEDDTSRTLKDMLHEKTGGPLSLKLHFLQAITDNFSQENLIGCGGFGEVYKGVLEDGFVAVKKLYSSHTIEEEPFHREVDFLMNISHRNIVCFVGYCAETHEVVVRQGGLNIFAEKRERLLCFEYLRNGSLHKYLTDEPCGFQWRVCYKIIKGICLGLHYLHERHIIHLDLKPDNILLDDGMVPKIADFGLSRLLGEEKSRTITQTKIGTRGYMAPEYLDDGEITIKSDIYSLGVIIRHMVKGHNTGAMTDQDVLESWVIRLEKESSQMRQTQWEIGYQKQIKACIEISQRCTLPKPKDRPCMQDILRTLEETEAGVQLVVGPTLNVGRLEIAKFGPWGGDGGKPRDIKLAPYRLDSITISSGTIIDSIEFSYTDHDGMCHTIGPWGGCEGKNKIQLGSSEFLTGVSGTVGPFRNLLNVITSLTFVTNNARSYGPFGKGRGTPFHVQIQNNGKIVGFFGRSNQYLNAIGVYMNQDAGVARIGPSAGDGGVLHDITDHNEQEHGAGPSGDYHKLEIAKFGPWGGDGGSQRDIKILPYRLDRVTIRSGTIIDAIEFSYTDHDGQYHTAGPWGGQGGGNNSFQLGPSEFLTGVSGSIGQLNNKLIVITSLTFVTNARSYGPFGKGRSNSFHIPMQSNGSIVGFFGRSGHYLDSIGVYTNHELETIGKEEAGVTRIGPWGGDGKVLHDIKEKPHHLQRVTIFSGSIINSLEYLYSDKNGQQHTAGPWGGCGGTGRKVNLMFVFGCQYAINKISAARTRQYVIHKIKDRVR
ncbi:uncharacterized protein [Setaria viridis]|uniref:uncharacterized protein isoform X2 n=1 Tax=Setaria viridis TaxID=4556 RepID=UPI001493DC4D|nr:phytosulfokine receptor 1-like isoform X3 [Setaria viridis]